MPYCVDTCPQHCNWKTPQNVAHLRLPDWSPFNDILGDGKPVALWPIGDQPFLYHWIDHFDHRGYRCVHIAAVADAAQIEAAIRPVRDRWNLRVQIEEAKPGAASVDQDSVWLDRMPWGWDHHPWPACSWGLLDWWMRQQRSWMNRCLRSDGSDLRSLCIGKWCVVHHSATLHYPLFLEDEVYIGPHAEVGPYAFVGHGSMITAGARVEHAWIGPGTYTGRDVSISRSILKGKQLIDLVNHAHHAELDPLFGGAVHGKQHPFHSTRKLFRRLGL